MVTILRDIDVIRVLDMIAPVFVNFQPMCKALDMTVDDFKEAFYELVYACCSSGYSTAYICAGDIASVSLALLYTHYLSIKINAKNEKIKPLLDILGRLNDLTEFPSGTHTIIYQLIVGTVPKFMRRGYAHLVIDNTLDIAKKNNVRYVIYDATNRISQNIFIYGFGYVPNCSIDYHTYKWNDKFSFSGISDVEVIRVIREL